MMSFAVTVFARLANVRAGTKTTNTICIGQVQVIEARSKEKCMFSCCLKADAMGMVCLTLLISLRALAERMLM